MKYHSLSRRHFLVGSSAFTLSLPFLTSLMSRAHAQSLPNSSFFIFINSPHGGLFENNWAPRNVSNSLYSKFSIGGKYWDIKYANLIDCAGSNGISPTLGSHLNPYLSKMNLIEGMDIPLYLTHHRGLLGNYHLCDNQDILSALQNGKWDSLDYFLSRSSSFDSTLSSGEAHPIHVLPYLGEEGLYYECHSSYYKSNGVVRVTPLAQDTNSLFTKIFGSGGSSSSGSNTNTPSIDPIALKRKSIIDRVLASYNQVTKSAYGPGKRISYKDRQLLEEHVQGLREIEVKLAQAVTPTSNNSTPTLACDQLSKPSQNISLQGSSYWQINNDKVRWDITSDIVAHAVRCGACRLFSIPVGACNTYQTNDYHQDIAHSSDSSSTQLKVLSNYQNCSEHIYANFVKKLDALSSHDGKTALDHGLVVWTHESGTATHYTFNMPIVTAGSADGFFKTGYHIDFRNPNGSNQYYRGIHYNRWLANIALSMGVSASEFEKGGQKGYGPYGSTEKAGGKDIYADQKSDLSLPLPFITKNS